MARQDHDSGALRGDIDGDGGYEVIWLAFDRRAEPGCQVFLAATSGSMTASLPIVQPEMDLAFFPPALNGLAPIDTDPGLEVVVDLVTGASTRFVGVFGAPAGVWNRVEVAGSSTRPANLFAYGGSVAHLDGVDCARPPGTIVLSSASPKANRYLILSRYYRVAQGRSTPLPARTTRQVIHAGDLDRFPELASAPFAGCT